MEKLSIRNFCGLSKVDLEFKDFNLIIGPQASGKSICLKLSYFFRNSVKTLSEGLLIHKDSALEDAVTTILEDTFLSYFPSESWNESDFEISYSYGNCQIKITYIKQNFHIEISENLIKIIKKIFNQHYLNNNESENTDSYKNNFVQLSMTKRLNTNLIQEFGDNNPFIRFHIFIPALRSLLAFYKENSFLFGSGKMNIDPLLQEFGIFYDSRINNPKSGAKSGIKEKNGTYQSYNKDFTDILKGQYFKENDIDYLLTPDKRKVRMTSASTGQQELLPLLLTLNTITYKNEIQISLYIEEPEAHIFPETQQKLLDYMVRIFNNASLNVSFYITTHSPYILTYLNNLTTAHNLYQKSNIEKKIKLNKIVNSDIMLDGKVVSAYSLKDGKMKSMVNKRSNIIKADLLDAVAHNINNQFSELLD